MSETFKVSNITGVVTAVRKSRFPLPYVISSPGERRVEEGMVPDEFSLRERLCHFPDNAVITLGESPQSFAAGTLEELYRLLRERMQAGQEVFPVRLAPMPGRGNPPLFAFTAKEAAKRAKAAFLRSASHTISVEFP